MGSSVSPLNATFSGSSTYSSSFQQVLTRALQMASLPMQQMQNHVNDLTRQQSALSSVESAFVTLQFVLQGVAASASGNLSATASDSTVSTSVSTNALPGTYSIQVDSLGSSTTTMSKSTLSTVADPTADNISSATSYTLTVNGVASTITPSDGSLESLATAINTSGTGVQATIVNVGGSSNPDYRLAVTSNNLGADSIQLNDGTGDLLDTLSTGAQAEYRVNGGAADVQSNSRSVILSPGLTVNLLAQNTSGQPTTIQVSNTFSSLQSALSNFASAYNATVDTLAAQRGQNAGPLSGQSIILTLSHILSGIAGYATGTGTLNSLASLGVTVDQTGHLSFDSSTLNSQPAAAIRQFLGTATSGGFLQTATQALSSAADNTSGAIENELNTIQDQINGQNDLITKQESRLTDLQNSLQEQLSQADAIISTLQAQKSYFTQLFQAEYPGQSNA